MQFSQWYGPHQAATIAGEVPVDPGFYIVNHHFDSTATTIGMTVDYEEPLGANAINAVQFQISATQDFAEVLETKTLLTGQNINQDQIQVSATFLGLTPQTNYWLRARDGY